MEMLNLNGTTEICFSSPSYRREVKENVTVAEVKCISRLTRDEWTMATYGKVLFLEREL